MIRMLFVIVCYLSFGCHDMTYDQWTKHKLKNGGVVYYDDEIVGNMSYEATSSFQDFLRDCKSPCTPTEQLTWSFGIFSAKYYPPKQRIR